MNPQHARMYAYVHPLFWGWLWLQLQLFTSWQKESHRGLLVAVTRWSSIYTVQIGDKVTAYRKLEAVKPGWDDPIWQSATPPNLAGAFREVSELPPTENSEHILLEAHPEYPCWSIGFWCPFPIFSDECVCEDDELSHDGGEGKFWRLSPAGKMPVGMIEVGVEPGGGEGWHIE